MPADPLKEDFNFVNESAHRSTSAFGAGLAVVSGLLPAEPASAHGFGAAYNFPVPPALYQWGAAATLVLSFLLVALFWSAAPGARATSARNIRDNALVRLIRRTLPALRLASLFALGLCIATGFLGSPDPLRNFSSIFFWVIFLLLFTYLLAFIGDAWAALNPFRVLTDITLKRWSRHATGLLAYPQWLASWPALLLYISFIWFELFSHRTPKAVAAFLLAYSFLNILGVILIGSRAWFRHCEFFSVFFRLVALMAPIDYQHTEDGQRRLRLRPPLSGLIHERPTSLATVVFVLAMISTTAIDGLQATQWWVGLFWTDPAGIFTDLAGASPMRMMNTLMPVYIAWETFWLAISPFVYLAAYLLALWLSKLLTGSSRPLRQLARDFSYSLIPIALVYNITHYWTLITTHGMKIFSLISDPFGWRWDLFGTAMKFRAPILPDMGFVWHSQVALILFGHVLSVWVAHQVALRIWPTRMQALVSQLPLLVIMVAFTVFGLWVLAQPLTAILPR